MKRTRVITPETPKGELLAPASNESAPYDADTVKTLASIGCTKEECAQFYGRDKTTFIRACQRRPELEEAYQKGIAEAKISLRHIQLQHARRFTPAGAQMAIHMSKHLLGEKDEALKINSPTANIAEFTFNFTRPAGSGDGA